MTFTYLGDGSTDRDRVRIALRDRIENDGPLPGDTDNNWSDEELDGIITNEGKWQRAVAAGYEQLAVAWGTYVDFRADGLQVNRSDIADRYQKLAEAQRKRYGYSGTTAGVRTITRVDGYSDDVSIDAV